jgi:ferric-dicitrate binding protein FerR (iron transport regulator)
MEISPDLIQRFFENRCEPEEQEAVKHYLSQYPEEVKKYLPFSEWEETDATTPLPEYVSERLLENIRAEVFPRRKTAVRTMLKTFAKVAAVLVPVIGVILFLCNSQRKSANVVTTGIAKTGSPSVHKDTTWVYHTNTGARSMTVSLPDGSAVRLLGHSSLKYPSFYGKNKRDVYLDGDAFFEVVKQSAIPFTVSAGTLRTTVLGTSFKVSTHRGSTQVKLFTGKVMISPVGKLPGWVKDIYLQPGEQADYNKNSEQVTVTKSRTALLHTGSIPGIKEQDSVFNFKNTPLQEVFKQLSHIYPDKINYNRKDISGLNLTAIFSHTDSLEVILKLIANMNDLEVQKTDSSFSLVKPQQ